MRLTYKNSFAFIAIALAICLGATEAFAQTTSFVYQGKLTDGGAPANGNYDFQFTLWDSLSGGAQLGTTQTVSNAVVSNGVFTVTLDFGATNFPGADRFLEISARPTGAGSFTLLTPRQQVTSTPYAVRSANSASANALSTACTGCITDTQIGSVAASKLTGTLPVSAVPAGSGSYVQNSTGQQAASNFNISGRGVANVFDAATQFNLGGNRILSNAGFQNLAAGVGAGQANTGLNNSFFGYSAGLNNTSGRDNTFIGAFAGDLTTSGNSNTAVGTGAGTMNGGSGNTFLGAGANGTTSIIVNATAIGAYAQVTQNNSLVLGSIKGVNGATADTNVGIGTTAPLRALQLGASADALFTFEPSNGSPNAGYIRFGDNTGWKLHIGRSREKSAAVGGVLNTGTTGVLMTIQDNGNVGIGTTSPVSRLAAVGLSVNSGDAGIGITGKGGNSNGGRGGNGLNATGGDNPTGGFIGGDGLKALGGAGSFGGAGVFATGGGAFTTNGRSGAGVIAQGGASQSGSNAGPGIIAGGGLCGTSVCGDAALFTGHVQINGNLDVDGDKNFKIDHPLDPANKYLRHAAIESSEVLDVYSGNVVADQNGEAIVKLPDWFQALNRDFRYQLTPIGAPAQGLYIAEEIKQNRFRIAGAVPGLKISWQVTGVRSDAVALKNPLIVEEDKPALERGSYLRPEAFGQPEEKSYMWRLYPELMRQMKERTKAAEAQQKQEQK